MSYHIELTEEDRILLVTECEDFDLAIEGVVIAKEMLVTLDALQHNVVMIVDTRAHGMRNMNELMAVSSIVRSETGRALVKHAKVIKMLIVTHSSLARLAMKGLNSATFGHVETFLYDDMNEALNDARTLIAEHAAA